MSKESLLGKYTFQRTQLICQEAVTLFLWAVVPYKDLRLYSCYLDTFWKVTVLNDANTRLHFKFYFAVLFYMLALYIGLSLNHFFAFPFHPLAHLVLFNPFFVLRLEGHLYLLAVVMMVLSLIIYWMLYFRAEGVPLNVIAEALLFKNECSSVVTVPTSVNEKYVCFDRVFTRQKFIRQALRITNFFQVFMILVDGGLIVYLLMYCKTVADYLLSFDAQLLLAFIALLPILLLQTVIAIAFIVSFAFILIFLATYAFVSLLYLITAFQRNIFLLKKGVFAGRLCSQRLKSKVFCFKGVRRNVHLFEVIFIADAFYGKLFLAYMVPHLPFSAYFGTQIVLGYFSGLPLFIAVMLITEALIGILIIHLVIGYLSSVAHRGGKLLLSFVAAQSELDEQSLFTFLPERLKLHLLLMHISRLHVNKKYGISYGGKPFDHFGFRPYLTNIFVIL